MPCVTIKVPLKGVSAGGEKKGKIKAGSASLNNGKKKEQTTNTPTIKTIIIKGWGIHSLLGQPVQCVTAL